MLKSKDPAIKLFGMKILFPAEKDAPTDKPTDAGEQGSPESPEKKNYNGDENAQTEFQNTRSRAGEEDEEPKDESESGDLQENSNTMKPLKKPTKILPCPRCNSMDTKFCYYNNYNINQPRHFCKACQRYWTAGGSMRNVPVGAGRRKNKNSSAHYRHLTISEALQAARIDSNHPAIQTNARVLSFGREAPNSPTISDSMASMLKLGDQTVRNDTRNGFHNLGDHSHSKDEQRSRINNMNGFACIPSVAWPYTWSPAISGPGYLPPPGFPMSFYPYWGIPMASPQSSSSSQKGSSSSGPNSPTLGKHLRDEETVGKDERENPKGSPNQRNGYLLVPKTLRVDDPKEAAKSSIWTTLGIKNEMMSKGGMFRGFDQKENNKTTPETSPVLRSNPAALSRSLNFHERM